MPPIRLHFFLLAAFALLAVSTAAPKAFRRDPGHPQWHHSAFQDVRDTVRSDVRHMLHSRAEVPFQVPLEVNIVLVGFNGDGGYRFTLDPHKLEEFMKSSFPVHRPSCMETGELLDIEHHMIYNVFPAGQPELIVLEKMLKDTMIPAGSARETEYGREVPLYEVDAVNMEPIFEQLYSFIFDSNNGEYANTESKGPSPSAIFVVNFDKVRMDPRKKDIDLESYMDGKIGSLTSEELKKQEGDYIYRYRYGGGGATQVWLGSGRFLVIDLSAGPCTYGKIETEEGSVSYRTLPRLSNLFFPRSWMGSNDFSGSTSSIHDVLMGQLAALVATTIEHVIAPDLRFETVDLTTRLLVPIIVLQNHNRYNILAAGHNYSIDIAAIEKEVKRLVHPGQEVVIIGGAHALHVHEKLAIAVSKAMRGHSLQETKNDGRFHVRTTTYLDGAILKKEMERSADVLAAGILEVADPSLSSKFFLRQHWMDDTDASEDSVIKHRPLWATYSSKLKNKERFWNKKKNHGNLHRTYGTRVIPVFVLSLAGVDPNLLMEDENLVWASKDVVIVLQHENSNIPLSYVSETERRYAVASQAQRHILAGLASAVGGLSAPYEKASHVHERPVLDWLWATGCHPFGPFSNASQISKVLQDVALARFSDAAVTLLFVLEGKSETAFAFERSTIYGRVDSALRNIRETSEAVQAFASQYLRTPLGEPVKGKRQKTNTELWIEKFYKKTTNLPEPFPHELVQRLEQYLDNLEEQLVDLSSLLYDHRIEEAHFNSTEIFQSTIFTRQYVDRVLVTESEKMRCCKIEYKLPIPSSQGYIYGAILVAGFLVYFLVIFFSSPVR